MLGWTTGMGRIQVGWGKRTTESRVEKTESKSQPGENPRVPDARFPAAIHSRENDFYLRKFLHAMVEHARVHHDYSGPRLSSWMDTQPRHVLGSL